MKVNLEKVFPIEGSAQAAWECLQDIKSVAECMPGAEITEQIDESHYKGQVKLKIGPATAAFKGTIEIKGINPNTRELKLLGKGADLKGTSSASMELTAMIREVDARHCELVGNSEVVVNGKMASFGGRMMGQVSDQILKQFAGNFADRVIAKGEGAAAREAASKVSQQPKELNAFAILCKLIVGYFKNLFGRKSKQV
ncbi:MAG: SRPBCC family protein [Gammaproteobacteria bacterium]